MAFFENVALKEVARVASSSGEVYLVVETHVSLEDQITKKAAPSVFVVKEGDLDAAAKLFLRSFMPTDNSPEHLVARVDEEAGKKRSLMKEMEVAASQLQDAKVQVQMEFEELRR